MASSGKSVWGIVNSAQEEVLSFSEVMSEQLAHNLDQNELKKNYSTTKLETAILDTPNYDENDAQFQEDDCKDDAMIAAMLQLEFDREYDSELRKEEAHYNGSSKVSVSYSQYKSLPESLRYSDDSEDEDDDGRYLYKRNWDEYERKDKETGALPKCGYKKIGDSFITKHDTEICHRSNGKRIMEFPPGIETGDGGKFDMQLSNPVYNNIRNFSIKEGKRKNRVADKVDKSTASEAVDPKTRLLLYKMVNNGILDSINGIVSTGKEAVIMHGDGGPGPDYQEEPMNVPKEVALKIFKTTLNEFKNREKYIKDDYRFRDRFSKQNPRKVINLWAEKEYHNLMKMSRKGIRVPDPVLLKKHVLVMSFIGRDGTPAPKLKEAPLSFAEYLTIYEDVVSTMIALYNDVHLVHADLSEYNILVHDKQIYIIDVSQAVEPNHPHGLEFLYRDCRNITDFFISKLEEVNVPRTAVQLFNDISGLNIQDVGSHDGIMAQVISLQSEPNVKDNFENDWEKSKTHGATPSRPIPGRSRKSSTGKLSRSPKSPRSPSSGNGGGSSVGSRSSLASMTDDELKELKESFKIESECESEGNKVSTKSKLESKNVTFE